MTQELSDCIGHQRGWEVLCRGVEEPPGRPMLSFPDFRTFATALAADATRLTRAKPAPTTESEVAVVTDPHFTALLAHEIIGNPTELDRALKMETGYAGRSWLLRSLDNTQVGQQIASPWSLPSPIRRSPALAITDTITRGAAGDSTRRPASLRPTSPTSSCRAVIRCPERSCWHR